LGLPVVETVAVRRGGARALVERVDGELPTVPCAVSGAARADRHAQVRGIMQAAVRMPRATARLDDAVDAVVLHPVLGLLILATVMFLVFQAVYFLGKPMTDAIGDSFGPAGAAVAAWLPAGPLQGLVNDG